MRRSTTLLGSLAVAAAMIGATALPASAADTSTCLAVAVGEPPAAPTCSTTTLTTFDLTGGALNLSVQTLAALGNASAGTPTITGGLGPVTVNDSRSTTTGWIVTAASTAFEGKTQTTPSSSTAVSYTGGAVATTDAIPVAAGLATVLNNTLATPAVDVGAVVAVVTATTSGSNIASWNPALTVTMPTDALADTYEGTVTTSIT